MTIEDLLLFIYASLLCSSEGHPRPSMNVATDASNIKPVNMTKISYSYYSSTTCISKDFINFSKEIKFMKSSMSLLVSSLVSDKKTTEIQQKSL